MSQAQDVFTLSLSLAVSLTDNYSKQQPIGKVTVSLKDEDYIAVKNPSGFYLFFNLPTTKTYIVQVKSECYFDAESLPLTLLPPDKDNNVVLNSTEIALDPTPAYPFPHGATLIRGMVKDETGNPVPNANVTLVERALSTSTTDRGEYVFYLNKLTSNDISDTGFVEATTNGSTTVMTIKAQVGIVEASVSIDKVAEGASKSALAIKLNITS